MAHMTKEITTEKVSGARHDLKKLVEDLKNSVEEDSTLAESFERFLKLMPHAFDEQHSLVIHAARRAYELTIKAYKDHREKNLLIAYAHLVNGWILREERSHQSALAAFGKALEIYRTLPSNLAVPDLEASTLVAKANQLLYCGQAEKALVLLERAIKPIPRDERGRFYWILGRAYFALGKRDLENYYKAIYNLKKAIEFGSSTWFIRAQLISAYALTNQLKEAQGAVRDYEGLSLDEIKNFYEGTKYRNENPKSMPEIQEAIQELLRGLQIAKEKANFL
jgi:tetratricopeptide (TPR) repeat protein